MAGARAADGRGPAEQANGSDAPSLSQPVADPIRNSRRHSLEQDDGEADELELVESALKEAGISTSQRCEDARILVLYSIVIVQSRHPKI